MSGETRKLHLIEEILKIESEDTLNEVETAINKSKINDLSVRKSFKDFAGMMTDEEADELTKIIEQGCEQIHPDDWK